MLHLLRFTPTSHNISSSQNDTNCFTKSATRFCKSLSFGFLCISTENVTFVSIQKMGL